MLNKGMAPDPFFVFGAAVGLIASIIVYLRNKSIKDTIITFITVFLAFGTPLHFILAGIYAGKWANRQIHRRWGHNWGAFLVSFLGVLPLFAIWQLSLRLIIGLAASSVDDPGGSIVVGIGLAYIFVLLILAGIGVYVLSSLYVSFKRRGDHPQAATD